jgi:hypothetical protein
MAFGKFTRREGMDYSTNIREYGNKHKSFIICTNALTCDRGAKKLEMSALLWLPTQSNYLNCAGKESLHKERSAGAQRKEVGFCMITRTYAGACRVTHPSFSKDAILQRGFRPPLDPSCLEDEKRWKKTTK